MAGKKGMKPYPLVIKERAVRMHLEEGITIQEVMRRLGIACDSRVEAWCTAYRRQGILGLQDKPKGRPRKTLWTEQHQLEHELNRLRMENELLRSFLYEAGRR